MSASVPDATGDQGGALDLDAIEARAGEAWRATPLSDDVLALVAEVRRLRFEVRRLRLLDPHAPVPDDISPFIDEP